MFKKDAFIHHVFFWLKNPNSAEDELGLVEGLKKLSAAGTIKSFHMVSPRPLIVR
jgi:hypothetical protein